MPAAKVLASPPTLSPDQLELYLHRIQYGEHATPMGNGHPRLQQLQKSVEQDPLAALTEVQRRHVGSIPWGNTALHYSNHHSISIHPACVFEKLVVRRLDGYCMENTNLLYLVLCSLGYQSYPTGGRVSRAIVTGGPTDEGYISLSHMILIVTIAGQKYMADVGFGLNTPTSPLLLQEGATATLIAPSEMSLIKAPLPEFTDQTQKVWVYQARNDPQSPWRPQYSFSDVEFLFEDFIMMNFFTSQSRSILFTQKLACTRVILDDQCLESIGIYILAGREVKRILHGKTETIEALSTEEDRVNALVKYFGLRFREHELEGIQGLASQIKSR
ncbi:N-terminal acetyltransferase [Aspergillus nanangensis]|uniref:N-terminal acetyltransferase n=1 Tax=Aspergillus nanangensis TaxID=2582783 RepID=A0AAD4CLW8_ASPNN|nr:N-terminal acetyltransferase [Aspergillus nanangensis]